MHHESLKALFEQLCQYINRGSERCFMHFEGGIGIDMPDGAMMIFLFDRMVLVYRFEDVLTDAKPLSQSIFPQKSLASDQCIDMIGALEAHQGWVSELFSPKKT